MMSRRIRYKALKVLAPTSVDAMKAMIPASSWMRRQRRPVGDGSKLHAQVAALAFALALVTACRPSGGSNAITPSAGATSGAAYPSAILGAPQTNAPSAQVDTAVARDAEAAATAPVLADAATDDAPPCPVASPRRIWCGRSGGLTWDWRTDGLTVQAGHGAPGALLVRKAEAKRCNDADESYRVLSIVGALVSFENVFGGDCGGAHPQEFSAWTAVDAARGAQPVSLATLFPEGAILRALLADRLVKKALQGQRVPESLDALLKALAWMKGGGEPEGCAYTFGEDLLQHFAFHHVEGGQVAVRIGLSHGCEVMRGNLTQIGILLPIPAGLIADLASAASREHGFLMKDAAAIAGEKSTSFHYP